ncbi:beta-ketoacyl-ACP synthase III [Sideroxydans lithotrophicus]|uniref:3-Oxoacyl-(Acyl-carrier-protein (ACP)) synthase III domain protein n=1 Tax=Sideroxydans lithotrophicus (strain ES-1) TaxID=580332 RepID=D5CLL3_SIDLE|nr:beta-ketoacyl-ACP synthase III [Sideroxydans lithotrophicus]ADE10601.1 3-Oxoacyl-(acyl-carrier-protein (ACP)) synthase III domain protein [Sideroxydans lithotrophicus ES-1]
MSTDVFLTRTASFLPLEPVGNDEMESVLGMVGGKPSKARRIVLRNNGIQHRYYALDRVTGLPIMSNAEMAAAAVRNLGEVGHVDCLATATSRPDQLMPGHGVMVHGALGWPRLEVVSLAGICVAGAAAFKHAWLAVRAGDAQRAVAVASELASVGLHARNFAAEAEHKVKELEERPEIAFEKDFLRWMLSDGAGAVLLESRPSGPLSLKVEWVELSSAAHELPACMYSGAEKNADDSLTGWQQFSPQDWATRSVFTVKQDVKLLNENVIRATLTDPLRELIRKHDLAAQTIDWFLPHYSSKYFAELVAAGVAEAGLNIPRANWFTNLIEKGNTGSASPYIMLDELFHSGRIKKGHKLLMYIPESGRFSSGFIFMEAV